ncbi:hypothetical protein C8J57DRAFT_1463006 [Mycena rebaudengoi]|nr:hypothetical protein C8J57DRAFT_1484921 [Mycena rebaudengoi]KAJ7284190.1 hypothetical protein C8J57DRAFT_1463006 [Mycena rebaudengoi]
MAKFTLTKEYVAALLEPITKAGDWSTFVGDIDPAVRWVIGSEKKDPARMTGVYNLASWRTEVGASVPLGSRLKDGAKISVLSLEVVGTKAIVEIHSERTKKNGQPYNTQHAWFLTYSEETGNCADLR